jgi:phenylacetic acid degradation protein
MPLYELSDLRPVVSPEAFVHPDAVLIGDVHIDAGCMIAPGAVLRADIGTIRIGRDTSIQDNVVIHANPGVTALIEERVIVGHGALLHDVHVHSDCIIGMGAILLFNVVCEAHAVVAAGSLVKNNTYIPTGKLAAGNPAVVIRDVSEEQRLAARMGAEFYVELGRRYRNDMRRIA